MFFKINHFPVCYFGYVIFSNRDLQLVANYVLKMVIKFPFCVVSLLWTSRYVLIDISNLTHFLCCNLFVMFYLTLSAISTNVWKFAYPSLSVTLYGWLISSQIPCNALLQRFPRMFSKFAWITLRDLFVRILYI